MKQGQDFYKQKLIGFVHKNVGKLLKFSGRLKIKKFQPVALLVFAMIIGIGVIQFLSVGQQAYAAGTVTWQGDDLTNPTFWNDPDNWDTGVVPATGDDVVLSNAANCNVNANTANLKSFDMTGYTGTLSGASHIYVTGVASATSSIKFAWTSSTWTGYLYVNPTAADTNIEITMNGKTIPRLYIQGNSSADVYFLDAINISNTLSLISGVLHFDGLTDNAGLTHTTYYFSSSGAVARTINMGACTITVTHPSNVAWDLSTSTNLNFICGTSTIIITGASSRLGSGLTYNVLKYVGSGGTQIIATNSSSSIGTLWVLGSAAKTNAISIGAGISLTVTGELKVQGDSDINRVLIHSGTIGTAVTITLTGATLTNNQNCDFRDIAFVSTGAVNLSAITGNSGDCGGNSISGGGTLSFTTPANQTWTNANGGSWTTVGNWSSRVPLPQDTAVMGMAYNSGITISIGMPRFGSINWTGTTYAGTKPTMIYATFKECYGSITLSSNMTHTGGSNPLYMLGRGANTITSAGNAFTGGLTVNAVSGSVTVQDAFSAGGYALTLTSGTFDGAGYTITCGGLASSGSVTRTLTMGGGLWTINNYSFWDISTTTNLTFNKGTSDIAFTWASVNTAIFAGGGLTYNDLSIVAGTGIVSFTGSNTFDAFTVTGTRKLTFASGTTQTITTPSLTGTAGNVITLSAASLSTTPPTLAKAGGGTVNCDYLLVAGVNVTPAATWYQGANSVEGLVQNFAGQAATGDYITAANSATANQISGATSFSLEAWFVARTQGGGSSGVLFSKQASNAGYSFRAMAGNAIKVFSYEGATVKETNTSTAWTPYGLTHVVATWTSGGAWKVYINGSEASYSGTPTAITTPDNDSANALILGNNVGRTTTFDGVIYSERVYRNVALTSGNVTTLYNAGNKASNPISNATSEYLFNEGTGATVDDAIGGADGTITGSDWANTGWNIAGGVPNAPTNVAIGNIGTTTFDTTWTDNSSDETGFKVYISTTPNADCSLATYPALPDYTTAADAVTQSVTGKSVNSQYCAKVIATNAIGDSAPAYSIPKYTLANVPSAPTVNNTALTTSLTAIINVNSNPASTEFAISCDSDTTFLNFTTNACEAIVNDADHWRTYTNWGGAAGFSDTGLLANTNHTYKVIARNGDAVNTALSSGASKYTLIETPTGITFGAVTDHTIAISASGTLSNLSSGSSGLYFTETSGNPGGGGAGDGFDAWTQTNSLTDTGLNINTAYSYKVKARNGDGTETVYSSPDANQSTSNTLQAPSNVALTADSTTQITVSWTDNSSSETGNKVYISTTPNADCSLATYSGTPDYTTAADAVSQAATSLAVNTQYCAKVVATNGSYDSNAAYAAAPFYTLANVPSAPTVNATSDVSLTVIINVNSNPAATQFIIYNQTATQYVQADGTLGVGAVWQTYSDWGSASGIANTGLTPSTSYTYEVKARNGDNTETAYSATASATTLDVAATPTPTPTPIPIPTPTSTPIPSSTPTPTSSETATPVSSEIEAITGEELIITPVLPTESAPETSNKKEDIGLGDFHFYTVLEAGNIELKVSDQGNIEVIKGTETLVEIAADIFAKKVNVITLSTQDTTYLMNLLPDKNKYQAVVPMPAVKGEFEFRILVIYEDGTIKEIKKIVTVDPQGYVYTKSSNYFGLGKTQEVRIDGATVALYKLEDGAYKVWNASQFKQTNPVATNSSGEYAFYVPNGEYYLVVEKAGYKTTKTDSFKIDNLILNKNVEIELKIKPWIYLILILSIGAILVLFVRFIIRRRKKNHK